VRRPRAWLVTPTFGVGLLRDTADIKFTTALELGGKTATGFEVPAEVVESLGSGRKPAVTVAIAGYSYRSTVAVMGGRYMIPFSAEHRTATGLEAGAVLQVELTLDTAPRSVSVPDDLAEALAHAPAALAFFDALSYSKKRGIVMPIEEAKSPETRRRRIEKSVAALGEGRER
jgi:hypothetical protein